MNIGKYNVFIFDLDNTIYDEKNYLFPAYQNIAKYVASQESINEDAAENFLIEKFQHNGRTDLFDNFIAYFNIHNSTIKDFLHILRTNKTLDKIRMFPVVGTLLKELIGAKKKIFVLTNGNVEQQRNKILLIDWEGLEEHLKFIFANEIEKKPSPKAVLQIINDNHFKKEEMLFIGDNLEDELSARNAGISFLNVKYLL